MSDEKRLEAGGAVVYASNNSDENIIKLQNSTKYINDVTVSKSGDSKTEKDDGSNAAIYLFNKANFILDNSELYINGKQADGIFISDDGSSGTIQNTNISIAGTDSAGLYNNGGIGKLINNKSILGIQNSYILNSFGGSNTLQGNTFESVEGSIDSSLIKIQNNANIYSDSNNYTSDDTGYIFDLNQGTFESSNDTITGKKNTIFYITKENTISLTNDKIINDSNGKYVFVVDNGTTHITISKDTTYTGKLLDIKNNSVVNLYIDHQDFSIDDISIDKSSELNITINNGSLDFNNSKLEGYIKISLISGNLKLKGDSYISEFEPDFDSNLIKNDHNLFVNGEIFVDGLQVGSVVNYTSDDKSIYERNCIIIRKRVRSNNTIEFIVYDADDHIAYIANESNLKSTGKSVDITPLLDEIEDLLKDIDVYKSGTTIIEKDPDENGIIVDGTVVSLTDMTVLKSGDSQRSDHSYNSAVYVLNTGSLSLDKSAIVSKGKYSDGVLTTTKSNTSLSNSSVTTDGDGSIGIEVDTQSNVSSNTNTVVTNGVAEAVVVKSNSKITITNGSYTSNESIGLYVKNNSTASINNAEITGSLAGIASYSENKEDTNTIQLDGSTISSKSSVIDLNHCTNIVSIKNGNLNQTNTDTSYPVIENTGCDSIVNLENTTFNMNHEDHYIAHSGSITDSGNLTINAKNQKLSGKFVVEEGSTLTLNLDNSQFDGIIENKNSDGKVFVNLTNGSSWTLEADTYIDSFTKDDTSTINFNGHDIYVYDKDDLHKYIKYEEKHPGIEIDHYDNEEDKINTRVLKVIPEKNLPYLPDRDKNTVYFVYDKMEIYIYRSKFNDPFSITDKLPETGLVNNMLYILSEDEEQHSPDNANNIVLSADDSIITFKAGDVIAYLDYQKKLVARLDRNADDYEDSLKILRAANTITLLNSEARYINKQNRRVNLPFQNGRYQLSLNLDEDIEVNNNTVIFYNQKTEQFELDGDRSIEDLKLRNPNLYTGKSTNTAETTVSAKDIRTDIKISDDPNNGIITRGSGLFVDVSNFTNYDDFALVAQAFIKYKDIIDGYATEIADAVTKVTGSVSEDVINEKIENTLKEYESTITDVLNKYDAIQKEADDALNQSGTIADQKIEKAKQDILNYIDEQENPWTNANTTSTSTVSSFNIQSQVLNNYRDSVLGLRENNSNDTESRYNAYGLSKNEQSVQDILIKDLQNKFNELDHYNIYSNYKDLPEIGDPDYKYIISSGSTYQIYKWDSNTNSYSKIYDLADESKDKEE